MRRLANADPEQAKIADRSSRMDAHERRRLGRHLHGSDGAEGFEKNWIPSVPGKNWFAYFRFSNPTEAYFDRSWPLADFEEMT